MGFFTGVDSGVAGQEEISGLQKALSAGYGTDSAIFVGGRALIPENLESDVVNVVAQLKEDCKVMNTLKKVPAKSTVHEINLRTDHGDWRWLSVEEGGLSEETNQGLERHTYPIKYLQTRRSVTKQMEEAETFEGALASEKLAGVETIVKAAEFQIFHGDSAVIPTEFDGFLASIKRTRADRRNIVNLEGKSIGAVGESLFDDAAQIVFERGGSLEKALFPPVLARDIKELFSDRTRFFPTDVYGAMKQLPDYPTAVGSTIKFVGDGAGADKFYHVKRKVSAAGNPLKRPPAPASVAAQVNSSVDGSEFTADFAGDYNYTVHAVNKHGISEGTAISAAATVAEGGSVTLTITPGTGNETTGYIICRSVAGGTDVMDMDKCWD